MIAATGGHTISFSDARSGQPVDEFSPTESSACYLAFSPNGRALASGHVHGEVILWDADSGEKLRALSGHTDTVNWVTWSPNGKMLASLCQDSTVRLWNVESGQELQNLPGSYPSSPVFSPDSRTLAYSKGDTMCLLDIQTGREIRTLPMTASSLVWSPNGRILAASEPGGLVRTWDVDSGRSLMDFTGHTDGLRNFSLAWSPDGRVLASGSLDGTIRLWDAQLGQPVAVLVPMSSKEAVIISSDGHHRGSPRVEQNLVYVVQTDAGQETLSPEQFAEQFGWKNDPSKVECRSNKPE
jgi:WD40 repeat protein